jgi:hypothetical protein
MGKGHDAAADTTFGQQFAGEDEQRHGDQDERFDSTDIGQINRCQRMAETAGHDEADGGRQQRVHQRQAGQGNGEKHGEQGEREHVLPFSCSRNVPGANGRA